MVLKNLVNILQEGIRIMKRDLVELPYLDQPGTVSVSFERAKVIAKDMEEITVALSQPVDLMAFFRL